MNDDKQRFFMMTIEIRILATLMARISFHSLEERFNSYGKDLSGLQYGVLRVLSHESATLSELSRQFALDPSTLVPVIDTLERKGLIIRRRDPNDRRRIPLSLSEAGADLIREVPFFQEEDLLYQCLGSMGEDKAVELLSLLREVVKRMPDGETLIESVTSRLYALQEGETVTPRPECIIHRRELSGNEHHRMITRSIKRRGRTE